MPSATTPSDCSSMPSPTTSPTSCASLALPREVEHWSLTTLREKLVKIGARIVRHGRYRRLPAGRGRRAAGALRRDPVSHRSAAATVAADPGMSSASSDRWQTAGRGAATIDRERPSAAARWDPSLMTRLHAASGAGASPRKLAGCAGTMQDRPSEASHLENPPKTFIASELTCLVRSTSVVSQK